MADRRQQKGPRPGERLMDTQCLRVEAAEVESAQCIVGDVSRRTMGTETLAAVRGNEGVLVDEGERIRGDIAQTDGAQHVLPSRMERLLSERLPGGARIVQAIVGTDPLQNRPHVAGSPTNCVRVLAISQDLRGQEAECRPERGILACRCRGVPKQGPQHFPQDRIELGLDLVLDGG